jgi:hypothetical protein
MDDKQLQETFRRAAEIASVVPESMHQAAFNRALDSLMGTTAPTPSPATPHSRKRSGRERAERPSPDDPVAALLALERSRAPEVDEALGGPGKALALLLVARRELEIDGLTTQQIATVLTEKFRHRVTRQALNKAMDRAGNRVDRMTGGRATRYRIMQAGEDWLAAPAEDRDGESKRTNSGTGGSRPRRKAKRTAAATEPRATDGSTPNTQGASTSKRSTSRRWSRGPKAAVENLIDGGWFDTPRGLSAIRGELESRLALRFKPTDLSPAMTRLLREGRLKRSKTEAGQYEYQS